MADDALPPLPYLQDVTDVQRKLTAEWSRWLNLLKQRVDYVTVTGIIDARTIVTGTIAISVLPPLSDLAGNLTYAKLPTGAGTWTADPTINGVLTVAGNVLPSVNDLYDLGSAVKLWRSAYLSNIKAVLFAKETQSLYGGWLSVTKNAGVFATDIATVDTDIDFGMAMTVNQFVLVRGTDAGGALATEYMKVGANVVGNVYAVTRNLSGAGLKAWSKGTPFAVRGVAGDGWVELNAYDTPRMSVFTQGSLYSNSAETIRIGHLAGMPNSSAGIGIYMGDAASYVRWDGTSFKLVSGNATLDGSGLTLGTAATFQADGALKFPRPAGLGYGQANDVNAVWNQATGTDNYIFIENVIKGTGGGAGGSSGKARVYLSAQGWSNGGAGSSTTAASLMVASEPGLSVVGITADSFTVSGQTFERGRSAAMGEWTTPTFAAGDYTAGGTMTWTVAAGDVAIYAYALVGKTMFLTWQLNTTTVGGTLNPLLKIAVPGGFTIAKGFTTPAFAIANVPTSGVHEVVIALGAAGQSVIQIYRLGAINWLASTDNCAQYGSVCFEVS